MQFSRTYTFQWPFHDFSSNPRLLHCNFPASPGFPVQCSRWLSIGLWWCLAAFTDGTLNDDGWRWQVASREDEASQDRARRSVRVPAAALSRPRQDAAAGRAATPATRLQRRLRQVHGQRQHRLITSSIVVGLCRLCDCRWPISATSVEPALLHYTCHSSPLHTAAGSPSPAYSQLTSVTATLCQGYIQADSVYV